MLNQGLEVAEYLDGSDGALDPRPQRRHGSARPQSGRSYYHLATKLDGLIRANGLMHRDVIKGLEREGVRITSPYLSQLRTGARSNPNEEIVIALAKFFDVPVAIFYHPSKASECRKFIDNDVILVSKLFDKSLSCLLKASAELSSQSVEKIVKLAEVLGRGEKAMRV